MVIPFETGVIRYCFFSRKRFDAGSLFCFLLYWRDISAWARRGMFRQLYSTKKQHVHLSEEADKTNTDILADVILRKAWIFGRVELLLIEICSNQQNWICLKVQKAAVFLSKTAALVVAGEGFEPTTSGLWARRATDCSTPRYFLLLLKALI